MAHRWEPITDLAPGWQEIANTDLQALIEVWREQRGELDPHEVRDFMERLQREWAIETGVIERLYTLDRGVTQALIERGLDVAFIPYGSSDRDAELVITLIRDQKTAVEAVFEWVRSKRPLSTSYVKELHQLFTRHQATTTAVDSLGNLVEVPLLHGAYKRHPNNPVRSDGSVHEYCPPEHVDSEMDNLIAWHASHTGSGVAPEVEAAWLHHRFAQIHPFQDGNGRVARALATHVLIRAGGFPLTITEARRVRYIAALEEADKGDLRPLANLFGDQQRRAFRSAIGIATTVQREAVRVSEAVSAIGAMLQQRRMNGRVEWNRAKDVVTTRLHDLAVRRFHDVESQLHADVQPLTAGSRYFVDSELPEGSRGHFNFYQVVEVAEQYDYFANVRDFHAWVRLVLREDQHAEIFLSFHTLSQEFRGVIAASLLFFRREEVGEGPRQPTSITGLTDEIFQVTFAEDEERAASRFEGWLEDGLIRGLRRWQAAL